MVWAFEISKLILSDTLSPAQPYLPILPKQSTNWEPSIPIDEPTRGWGGPVI